MTSPYLPCAHCGCEFLASERQLKRSRSANGASHRFYCSGVCQRAGMGAMKRKPLRYRGVCKNCGKPFESRHPLKFFCGMKCYTSSPEFQARVRVLAPQANAAMVLKRTGVELKPSVEVACLNCGVKRILAPAAAKRRKYCNQRCYRQYMAKRFDRWIASPEAIALPQAFDEFLSQEELPCLIDGCDWVGLHLGSHVNLAHGIPVEEFKRAAGFNLGTGLVTPAVSEALSARPHIHEPANEMRQKALERGRQVPPPIRQYHSLEGREHSQKALALIAEGPSTRPPKICIACGTEYQPAPLSWGRVYCSIKCRTEWYRKNHAAIRFWMPCNKCGKDFQGSIEQQERHEQGLPVFCDRSCRQSHNSLFRRMSVAKRERESQRLTGELPSASEPHAT